MNSTTCRSSLWSNQLPCCLHQSITTPEQPAKLTRFISRPHNGHGTYIRAEVETLPLACSAEGSATPRTASCLSRSSHTCWKEELSTHNPPHWRHSLKLVLPTLTI